jgi:hypothetical protein
MALPPPCGKKTPHVAATARSGKAQPVEIARLTVISHNRTSLTMLTLSSPFFIVFSLFEFFLRTLFHSLLRVVFFVFLRPSASTTTARS